MGADTNVYNISMHMFHDNWATCLNMLPPGTFWWALGHTARGYLHLYIYTLGRDRPRWLCPVLHDVSLCEIYLDGSILSSTCCHLPGWLIPLLFKVRPCYYLPGWLCPLLNQASLLYYLPKGLCLFLNENSQCYYPPWWFCPPLHKVRLLLSSTWMAQFSLRRGQPL
jgi:hypothetical protein